MCLARFSQFLQGKLVRAPGANLGSLQLHTTCVDKHDFLDFAPVGHTHVLRHEEERAALHRRSGGHVALAASFHRYRLYGRPRSRAIQADPKHESKTEREGRWSVVVSSQSLVGATSTTSGACRVFEYSCLSRKQAS
eukprot:scaffold705_cov402-Prasinococcus_capsulatus_cf.AAC.2